MTSKKYSQDFYYFMVKNRENNFKNSYYKKKIENNLYI